MKTRAVMVRVTFTMPVEVPEDWDDARVDFNIEENSCMWTGFTGHALNRITEAHDANGTCPGCALRSKVELLWDEPVRDVMPEKDGR